MKKTIRKKIYYFLFILFILLPIKSFAMSYEVKDLSISIDNSNWYVFTKDNIKDNYNLKELGVSETYLTDFMDTNNIYIDAFKRDKSMELLVFIQKEDNSKIKNLHNYSDNEINELAEKIKEKRGFIFHDIYTRGKYKYLHFQYEDSGYHLDEYWTIVNGYVYQIKIQKNGLFSTEDEAEIRVILYSTTYKNDDGSEESSVGNKVITAIIVSLILGGISRLMGGKSKKSQSQSGELGKEIKCPKCGSICYEGDNYCRNCRTKLNSSKEEYKCQNCGATVNPYDKECPNCGEAFEIIYKYSEEEIAKIYQEAEKNRINGNVDVAQKLYMKYIEVTESSMKEEGKKCYTFNNNIEFAIAAYKKELEKECININYNTSSAYFYLSYFAIDRKEYEEARKFLDLSLSYNPYNVASIFEKAELYKIEGNFKKYLELTKNSYEKIYYIKDLAHYYRNLGYYYTEKEKWELAKATYLYSLKYENNPNVEAELKYISSKSKDESLPKKEELTTILRENEIPTFISKDNLQIIKSIHNDLEKNNQLGSALGKFVSNLMKENSNS